MARINRLEKKKKERQEKRKALLQKRQNSLRRQNLEEISWQASNAIQEKNYEAALAWALKGLRIEPSDVILMESALRCAQILEDETALYSLLRQCWKEKILGKGVPHLLLGKLAYRQGDFRLAMEVLEKTLESARTGKWRLLKSQMKEVQDYLSLCSEALEPPLPPARPPSPPVLESDPLAGIDPPSSMQSDRERVEKPMEESLEPKVSFVVDPAPVLRALEGGRRADFESLNLALKAYRLSFRGSYDQLLCLSTLRNVESLWYQEETARKAMKFFRGRAILADEVGLGKTIEAGLILKEYLLRGLVRTVLVLVPSSLVFQWQEELREKFGLSFVSSHDRLLRENPERFWAEPFLLVSLQTARIRRHMEAVTSRSFDLVIVDEAHHLKNRATSNWKLVNALQKTFLLLLTATPVQNKLEELYNLVTLLKPGHLQTLKTFKKEFVTRGSPTDPRNREQLRQLLKEVMIRNTRSVAQLRLPPRFAFTTRVNPSPQESLFYQKVSDLVRSEGPGEGSDLSRLALRRLLEAAGSSHIAAMGMLEKMILQGNDGLRERGEEVLAGGREIQAGSKALKVIELLRALPDQKVVFVNYRATLMHLRQLLEAENLPHVVFHGGLTPAQKQTAMESFRNGAQVLLATGAGGEGYNLHFCHVLLNYDLPWNPMQIEQRIGRLHRIGQEKEVQVYNFCAGGSLEDHILEILDRKINMFELVIGEIEMILGRVETEQEFGDLVYEIWVRNPDENERRRAFDLLGSRLQRAHLAYEKSKELDEKLFGEDFGL
jgi:SNF2 family DNA or RNA helicase